MGKRVDELKTCFVDMGNNRFWPNAKDEERVNVVCHHMCPIAP